MLQRAQNALSRVVTYTRRTEHIRPVFGSSVADKLHNIDFKVAILAYKVHATGSPAYLKSSVSDYTPSRDLRSSSLQFLVGIGLDVSVSGLIISFC